MSLKQSIIELRKLGFSYNKIEKELRCSKGIISKYCKQENLNGCDNIKILNINEITELREFYKNHTTKETAEKFKCSLSTVKKYKINKSKKLSDNELKRNNYIRVKCYRVKIKERAVKYKGGCCEKCGYDKCLWSLHFHHKNSNEKDFTINGKSWKWEIIKNELDKCILLCANCHGEIHEELHKKNTIY